MILKVFNFIIHYYFQDDEEEMDEEINVTRNNSEDEGVDSKGKLNNTNIR